MVGNNNAFISSRAGDITLSRSSAPKSKKPLLIVALVIAVAISIILTVLVSTNNKSNNIIAEKYASLLLLIEKGPESTRGQYEAISGSFQEESELDETGTDVQNDEATDSANTWFIFAISYGILTQSEKNRYFSDLNDGYDELLGLSSSDEDLHQELLLYGQAMGAIINSTNLSYLSEELAHIYNNDGLDDAVKYVEEKAPCIEKNNELFGTPAGRTADAVNRYLNAQIDLIKIYSRAGCMDGDIILTNCNKVDADSKTIAAAYKEQTTAAQIISSSRKALITTFRERTESLTATVEGFDA